MSLEIVIPDWARRRIEAELGKLTEDVLRPLLTEAGVPDPGAYVLDVNKLPARRATDTQACWCGNGDLCEENRR